MVEPRCPYLVKQNGKVLHCIKAKGHSGAHQHRNEGVWYKPTNYSK